MAWPSNIVAGQAILASQLNGVIGALSTWGGAVNANGNTLSNVGTAYIARTTDDGTGSLLQVNGNASVSGLITAGSLTFTSGAVVSGSSAILWSPSVTFNGSATNIANLKHTGAADFGNYAIWGTPGFMGAVTFVAGAICNSTMQIDGAVTGLMGGWADIPSFSISAPSCTVVIVSTFWKKFIRIGPIVYAAIMVDFKVTAGTTAIVYFGGLTAPSGGTSTLPLACLLGTTGGAGFSAPAWVSTSGLAVAHWLGTGTSFIVNQNYRVGVQGFYQVA